MNETVESQANAEDANMDSALAYEKHAREFLCARDRSMVGVNIIKQWAQSLAPKTDLLEIACGGGIPVTRTLIDMGLKIWALDSSPTLVAEFQSRFPGVPVQCGRAEESDYFGRKFGAVISIGLLFLLNEDEQLALIRRVAGILVPGGRFLFTAPLQTGAWTDMMTGLECRSPGREVYAGALQESALQLVGQYEDEGKNNYYDAERVEWTAPRGAA